MPFSGTPSRNSPLASVRASGGGARLTEGGEAVLDLYRAMEAKARDAGAQEIAGLRALLREAPGG